ncbi:MAG: flagellar basal-body MS-ring/collar protein FliF [Paracoccaceae bacterium]
MRRRVLAIGAALGVFVGVLVMARLATTPGMALLYAGLEGARAGEVIQALEQRGLTYEVRGDAIYVPASTRDALRMGLAAEGLPANSAGGYELLDGLSGFGTTAQMFDAAYWRAKEGELARTIMASPQIRAARVHLAPAAASGFRREGRSSASVTVTLAGAGLAPQQAEGLRYLVASAVAGLDPADVAVIDSNGGVLLGETDSAANRASTRADELRANVLRLLEARVGVGRAVVEVSVDTVTDRETIVERTLDPAARVAVSQETEERNASSNATRASAVTVASNLPDGDASGGGGDSQSREVLARERINWDVSQTSREIERGPGAVRRITVAVLIDGQRDVTLDGIVSWTPRPEEELTDLRELVASAVGFDEARGDVITLRSMPFDIASDVDPAVSGGGVFDALGAEAPSILRLVILAMVILALALFVIRPALRRPPVAPVSRLGLPPVAGPTPSMAGPVLDGEIDDGPGSAPSGVVKPVGALPETAPDPIDRMRALIAERQDETIEILRHWMEDTGESR